MSDGEGPISETPAGLREDDPYVDTANRLERQIDTQVSIIDGIDNKSEHITRLIGILIGLVFSVLSIIANYDAVTLGQTTLAVETAFVLGIACLLLSMGAAIVTYLSSRFRIGLHHSVGYYVSNPESDVDFTKHIRRVCGSSGEVIEQNKRVIETNSRRFRIALCLLLIGVLFLSTAGIMYLGALSEPDADIGLVASVGVAFGAGWYILTGRYLTLEPVGTDDD